MLYNLGFNWMPGKNARAPVNPVVVEVASLPRQLCGSSNCCSTRSASQPADSVRQSLRQTSLPLVLLLIRRVIF